MSLVRPVVVAAAAVLRDESSSIRESFKLIWRLVVSFFIVATYSLSEMSLYRFDKLVACWFGWGLSFPFT